MAPNFDSQDAIERSIPSRARNSSDRGCLQNVPSLLLWPLAIVLLGLSLIGGPWYGLLLPRLLRSPSFFLLFELLGVTYLWLAGITAVTFASVLLLFSRPLRQKSVLVLAVAFGAYTSLLLNWYIPKPQVANTDGVPLTAMAYNVNYKLWEIEEVMEIVRQHPADVLGAIEPLEEDAAELWENVRDLYPHYYRAPAGNLSLLSRYPILSASADNLETTTHSLFAVLDVEGQPIQIVVVHPPPPAGRDLFVQRNATIAALATYASQQQGSLVVMGDFNATSWSMYIQNFVRCSGLRNASLGHGIKPTWFYNEEERPSSWTAWLIQALRIPIDHVFVSDDLRVDLVKTAPAGVSDHRPIIAKLRLPKR